MVTFEDFFGKKKIDLQALQRDEPELYTEFYNHYHAMGEKSFDHTKKFWFNKLRKSYKLQETAPLTSMTAETAAKSITAPVSPSLGFKSKFKTNTPPATLEKSGKATDKERTATSTEEPSSKPAGFKPRFKPGATKAVAIESPIKEQTTEENTPTENKPKGFTPKFKAGVTKTDTTTSETIQNASTTEEPISKPRGFKPRFKSGVTKAAAVENPIKEQTTTGENTPTENKPTGFKPRFKAGVTKSVEQEKPQVSTDSEQPTSKQENKQRE